ncbi:MAG: hypothetical protein AAGA68_08390 [Pseudomonadota bacterium]
MSNRSMLVMRAVVIVVLAFMAGEVRAERGLFFENFCSFSTGGVFNPRGVAVNTSIDRLAILDEETASVYLTNYDCEIEATFSIGDFASEELQDIAYDATNDQYAILDSNFTQSNQELFIVDRTGALVGSCDLSALGSGLFTGLTHLPETDTYLVAFRSGDVLITLDRSELNGGPCQEVGRMEIEPLPFAAPSGIQFIPGLNQYLVVDLGINGRSQVGLFDADFAPIFSFEPFSVYGPGNVVAVYVAARDSIFMANPSDELFASYDLYELDINGTVSELCDTAAVSSDTPSGVTYVGATNSLVWGDAGNDRVYVADADTCSLRRVLDLSGVVEVAQITYLPSTEQLVVVDGSTLNFVDFASGVVQRQCSVAEQGLVVSGIDAFVGLEQLVLSSGEALAVIDTNCNLLRTSSLLANGTQDAIEGARGVAYQAAFGRAAVVSVAGGNLDAMYVVDSNGQVEGYFVLDVEGLVTAFRVTTLGAGDLFAISDSNLDTIFRVKIPALGEPTNISGTFRSASLGANAVLFDRGEGRITGAVLLPTGQVPLYGQRTGSRVSITFETPTGTPVVTTGSISDDLNTISLGVPLGELTRQFE